MKSIQNILVPIDFTEESYYGLKAAVQLAEKFNSKINLFHFYLPKSTVMPYQPRNTALGVSGAVRGTLGYEQIVKEKEYLEANLRSALKEKVPEKLQGTVYVEPGTVSDTIGIFTKELDADLIVSGTSGSRSVLEYFGGNHTENIIRKSNVPVIAVSDENELALNNVLVATDLSKTIPNRIFEICKVLEQMGSAIHLVNIITTELIAEEEAVKRLHNLAKKFDLENYEVHVRFKDKEIKGILEIASEIEAGLILMKTYKKSTFWSFMTGSLAEKITRKTEIPIMVEKVHKK